MSLRPMTRALLALFLTLLTAPAPALETEAFYKQSFLVLPDDLADAQAAGKLLMLVYEQEGCPYCAKMHKYIMSDPAVRALLEKHFDVVQLDIWGSRELVDFSGKSMTERQFARNIGLHYSPVILFYGPNGKEVYRMAGFYNPPLFKTTLEFLGSGSYQKMSFLEFQQRHVREPAEVAVRNPKLFLASGSLREAASQASAAGKGVAILFDRPACADCAEMHAQNLTDPITVRLLTSHYVVVRVGLASHKELEGLDGRPTTPAELARRHQVRYTPTVVFLDAAGREQLRHDSYLEPAHFQLLLQYVTTDARTRFVSFQDWIRARNTGQIVKTAP